MLMASRKVTRDLFFSKNLLLPRQVSYGRLVPPNGHRRELSVFNDFSKKMKGEIQSNPELEESIKEMKVKAKELKEKAKGFKGLKDEFKGNPIRRKRFEYYASSATPNSMRTDIVVVPSSKQSPLSKMWEAFKNKMRIHPVFKRVTGISEPVIEKIAEHIRAIKEADEPEGYGDLKDYKEIPLQDPYILSYKEIRDPTFSLPEFAREIQEVVKPVLNAYFKGNSEILEKYCSSHVIEQCKAEHKAYESQEIFFDKKIIRISQVEVRETKMMGDTPIIIVAFETQQVYCIRDRLGAITEGGQDDILQTVNYAWTLQQLLNPDEVGNGAPQYPIWKIKDIQELGDKDLT